MTTSMLQEFIKKALKGRLLTKPRVIICIPSGVTAVERRAVKEVHMQEQNVFLLLKNLWLRQLVRGFP